MTPKLGTRHEKKVAEAPLDGLPIPGLQLGKQGAASICLHYKKNEGNKNKTLMEINRITLMQFLGNFVIDISRKHAGYAKCTMYPITKT